MNIFRAVAFFVLVLSTLSASYAAGWSEPRLLTGTELSPADGAPIVADNGEVIVGAWGSESFDGSVLVQRWTIDGDLLEPVPLVLRELGDPDGAFPRATPRVDDIVWDGSAFLIIWSSQRSGVSSTVIDRLDAGLQHQSRRVITTEEGVAKAHATGREIILIRGTTADFYSTDGEFISSIPFVIPGGIPDAFDIATDGHKFLLSGVFSHVDEPTYLYTIAVKSDRSASPAVIIPVGTRGWRYAIDVTYGGGGYLVTTVFSDGVVKTYRFDGAGSHTSTSTIYDYTDGTWAITPEVVWNGSGFELYWLPPNNPILVKSGLSADGVPQTTGAIEMDDSRGVLPLVVQAGSSRTYLWSIGWGPNRRLLIDHKPADVLELDGRLATWKGQTELEPQVAAADGATAVVWVERLLSERMDRRFVLEPRARLIDGTGGRAVGNLPGCTNLSLASSDVDVVLLSACDEELSISRLDRQASEFSDPLIVRSGPRLRITPQAIAWNGSGWTIVWTEAEGEGSDTLRTVKTQRLSPSFEPVSPIAVVIDELWLEGAYVSSNGQNDLVVVAAVDEAECNILCPAPIHPVELIRLDASGVALDRWIPFESVGVPRIILAPSPDGHVVVSDGYEGTVTVLHVPSGSPLAGARVAELEGWGRVAAAVVNGGDLWVGTNSTNTSLFSENLNSSPLRVRRLSLAPEIAVKEEFLVARHTTGAAFSPGTGGVPDVYTSEMMKRSSDGLSPRIYVRRWIEDLRRRPVRSR